MVHRALVVVLLLAVTACAARRTRAAADRADRDAIVADLDLLEQVLVEAYAGRALRTEGTWGIFQRELAEARAGSTPDTVCAAVGDALSVLIDPGLFVTGADGVRCSELPKTGGRPTWGSRHGAGVAANAPGNYALRTEGDVAVLGIRAFLPPTDPGWVGLDAEGVAAAPGLVLDLRGAGGDDPRALLPLLEALTGRSPLRPIRRVIQSEGAAATALRAAVGRTGPTWEPSAWAPLVGEETAGEVPHRHLTVLVGEGCEEACELVARVLQAYAGAEVRGGAGSSGRLDVGEAGVLVLPRTGLRVSVPLRAVVMNDGLGRWWSKGPGAPTPERAVAPDPLPSEVSALQETVAAHQRAERFLADPPPPCASLAAYERPEALPPEAAAKLDGTYERGGSIQVVVDLPRDAAEAYATGCPGVSVRVATDREPAWLWVSAPSFAELSRLLQPPVVRRVLADPQGL